MAPGSGWLVTAGALSIAAAGLHLACIVGGASWYRALGAGEAMAVRAARGEAYPALVTIAVAGVLFVWAACAFSAAGVIARLPLLRPALLLICAVLLLRGLGVPLMRVWRPDLSSTFLYVSSAIVLVFGLVFSIGTWKAWPMLSLKGAL